MNKRSSKILRSLASLAGVAALSIFSMQTATAATACVQNADCAQICGTTAPTGYATVGLLCQSASAVGSGFNNRCVRLMHKNGYNAVNVPNPIYSITCPQ